MTFLMKLALEQLEGQPLDTQKLWAARIINGLRGCPNGLAPGEFVPDDWGEGDEIFEALLATTSDDLRRAMEAAEAESGGERMSLEKFLDREAVRDGAGEDAAEERVTLREEIAEPHETDAAAVGDDADDSAKLADSLRAGAAA